MTSRGTTKYTEAVAEEICRRLADGESLNAICKDEKMPAESTVRSWAIDPDHPIAAKYARAREVGYEKMADELLEIADNLEGGDNRDRLRVETRKWLLSKVLPKVYGEKSTVEMSVVKRDASQLTDAELEQRILAAGGPSGVAPKANGKAKPN